MKKSALLLSLVLLTSLINAQDYFQWSQPEIITDTNSVYSNPFVIPYGYTSWMFYEKQETKSSILRMDLNNTADIKTLLSSETINYSKPYFKNSWNPSYKGFLFYLSDEEGADNLYAAKYYENDSVGEAFKIIRNPDNSNIIDYSIYTEGYLGYTIDSNVYAAELKFYYDSVYTEKDTLLDNSSFNIIIGNRNAYWQKIESDSSHILFSMYLFNADSARFYWTNPVYVDSIGDSRWLTFSTSVENWGGDEFCWTKNDRVIGVNGNYQYTDTNSISTFSQTDVRHLSMVNWFILVKYPYEEPHYLCFTTGLEDSSEIFSSHGEMGWEEGVFITDNNYPDDNPKVYFGEGVDYASYYVYCIWQSHINGKIALSMAKSKAFIGSAIDENYVIDNYLKVSPNPFAENLNISFNTYGQNAEIKIFDVQGRLIKIFEKMKSNNDWQSVVWQPASKISKGAYVVTLSLDGKTYVRKIVKQ